jgi:RimJ/RimL family protein N-acetyltransferase
MPPSRVTALSPERSDTMSSPGGLRSGRRCGRRATHSPKARATCLGDRASSSPAIPPELVGWGGFKGPPRDGVVELGYEIAESRRERGLATAAVRAMLAEAFADDRVEAVIAHTLPERNASNRVLEKAGFRFDGDGREGDRAVWRYRLPRPAGDTVASASA